MKYLDIRITGRVTGVGFRFYAMQTAYRYGIKGTIRNMPDKSLYIEAEGEDESMESFLAWCRKGPLGSRVDLVQVADAAPKNFQSFGIISSRDR